MRWNVMLPRCAPAFAERPWPCCAPPPSCPPFAAAPAAAAELSHVQNFAAGVVAGATACTATYPLESLRWAAPGVAAGWGRPWGGHTSRHHTGRPAGPALLASPLSGLGCPLLIWSSHVRRAGQGAVSSARPPNLHWAPFYNLFITN